MRKAILSMITLGAALNLRIYAAAATDYTEQFGNIIGGFYNLLYPIAIVYAIFQIVLAGYGILRSEGEPKAMTDAKDRLTSSIIGIIFVIFAVVLLKIIIKTFIGVTID